MTVEERYQLESDAAAAYEAQKVPAIFAPLASAVLALVGLRPGHRVLDIACGTGIVARRAAPQVMPGGRIVGVDLNQAMLDVAYRQIETSRFGIQWHRADVTRMPFRNGEFDFAICQQGMQFFPDRWAALKEMRRVLAPGGRLAVTVWEAPSDLFIALAEALRRHVGEEVAERALAPFSFAHGAGLANEIAACGFAGATARSIMIARRIGPAEQSLPQEIAASPVAAAVAAKGDDVLRRIVAETVQALAAHARGGGYVIPQMARLIEARVPRERMSCGKRTNGPTTWPTG